MAKKTAAKSVGNSPQVQLLNDVLKYLIDQPKTSARDDLIVRVSEAVVRELPVTSGEISGSLTRRTGGHDCGEHGGGYCCYRG